MCVTRDATVNKSMLAEMSRLRQMTVTQLQVRWRELYGEESRSRNRDYLWRRLAWRVQELAHGGLSDRARARVGELGPDVFPRACPPRDFGPAMETSSAARVAEARLVRDLRLPSVGTILTRQYRGKEIRVVTLEDGFEWNGRRFGSLSEVARAVTGQHWSGPFFFGLRTRTRRK